MVSSTLAGLLLGGGMALLEGANLWPLTAILGGVAGLTIGAILGVVLKFFKVPMNLAWFLLALVLVSSACVRIYFKHYYQIDFGNIVEATVVKCEPSPHVFVAPYRSLRDRRETNGVDITLHVSRERRLGKFQDRRIAVYEWRLADRTKTYFLEDTSCESMVSGDVIFMRTKDYGLGYDYVHRIDWDPQAISRDGRFILDK